MSNSMQEYFSHNKRFDFMETGDFFEALNNILDGIDSELNFMNEVRAEMESRLLLLAGHTALTKRYALHTAGAGGKTSSLRKKSKDM